MTIAHAAKRLGWSDEFLAMLREVLQAPTKTPMGPYCMGIVTQAVYDRTGQLPPRELLERAALCNHAKEAERLAEEWIERRGKEASHVG